MSVGAKAAFARKNFPASQCSKLLVSLSSRLLYSLNALVS